jgi:peptidoglycan hydrolase-like protein with peptidoglycan-binding domain
MPLVAFLVISLAGCATGLKKQATQASPAIYEKSQETYQQETYSRDYDYDDTLPYDTYKKPVKKTYSEPMIELSAKQIQKALKSAGFYQGSIDGKIGPKTKEAIIKFQKAHGLKADGIAGKRTSAELNKYLSR